MHHFCDGRQLYTCDTMHYKNIFVTNYRPGWRRNISTSKQTQKWSSECV